MPSSIGFASACLSGGAPSSPSSPSTSALCRAVLKTCAALLPLSSPTNPLAEVINPNFAFNPVPITQTARTTTSHSPDRSSAFVLVPRRRDESVSASANTLKPARQEGRETGLQSVKKGSVPQEDVQKQTDEKNRRRLIEEAWEVFTARFVDDSAINWHRIRRRLDARPIQSDEELEKSLKWLFARTHDPFTRYLSSEQLEAMKGDIDGEMCGVGIIFNAERHGWYGRRRVVIKHVVRSSPAAEAGLQRGDRITAIDMIGVESISFDEATSRLMGKEGKKVLISFCRKDESDSVELSVLLTRNRFEVPTVSAERIFVPSVGDVGFIQIREFAANTAAQTRAAVRQMIARNGVEMLILDMRGNSGGLVDRAVEVAKVFLQKGQIVVRFIGRNGEITTERCGWKFGIWRRSLHVTAEPMIVLVDADTASASELVAGALRDNCRAVIIGNTTFGKGSVQAIVPLSNGGGAAVTVARYKTPGNHSIVLGKGLRPDLIKDHLGDDGDGVVNELFGRGGTKRYKWVLSRLDKCAKQGCGQVGKGRRAIKGRNAVSKALPSIWKRQDGG